jgi:hypothetical protein
VAKYMTLNHVLRGRRIDGSPNFRRLPLTLMLGSSGKSIPEASVALLKCVNDEKMVCGRYDFVSPRFLSSSLAYPTNSAECLRYKGASSLIVRRILGHIRIGYGVHWRG